jgi:DinB superfamily
MHYVGMDMSTEPLTEAFGRISSVVHSALNGASTEVLTFRVDPGANTMAWLIWHLTRIQDDHIAELVDQEQVWIDDGWAARFGLPFDLRATGYRQSASDVAAVRVDAALLAGYYDAVHARTIGYLQTLTEADFARVVDTAWDPPVTLLVRLVSILSDDLQHAGQASYVRGLAMRAGL